MDGRHSNVLAFLERMIYCRAFHTDVHAEFIEVWNKTHHLVAKTAFGLKFKTEWQRLSGVADTSSANTLDTAFIAYYTYRMMSKSAEEAWCLLGIYGGDDGLSRDMCPSTAARAAAKVGQVLELDTVEPGKLGVKFLARRYGPNSRT